MLINPPYRSRMELCWTSDGPAPQSNCRKPAGSANEMSRCANTRQPNFLPIQARARRTSELPRKERVAYPNPEIHCEYRHRFCQPVEAQVARLKNQAAQVPMTTLSVGAQLLKGTLKSSPASV